jgi:hypothetical protein
MDTCCGRPASAILGGSMGGALATVPIYEIGSCEVTDMQWQPFGARSLEMTIALVHGTVMAQWR